MAERIGKFEIDPGLWRRAPKAVLAILNGCFPVRVEMMLHKGRLEYVAYGDHFDAIPEGETIPEYGIEIKDLTGGKYHVSWKRIET